MDYSRIHRLLKILTLIQGEKGWTPKRLALECETTERTIFRDLKMLEGAGIPYFFDEETSGYRVRRDFFMPPVQLTLEESLALAALAGASGVMSRFPSPRPRPRRSQRCAAPCRRRFAPNWKRLRNTSQSSLPPPARPRRRGCAPDRSPRADAQAGAAGATIRLRKMGEKMLLRSSPLSRTRCFSASVRGMSSATTTLARRSAASSSIASRSSS